MHLIEDALEAIFHMFSEFPPITGSHTPVIACSSALHHAA
jgi:hypothetical protein